MSQLKKQTDQAAIQDFKQLTHQYKRFKSRYELFLGNRSVEEISESDISPVLYELWPLLSRLEQMQATKRTLEQLTEIST